MPNKTFIHSFHNTTVNLNVTDGQHITDGQRQKLERVLCGMNDCGCHLYPVKSEDGHWTIYKDGKVIADEVAKAAAALGRKGGSQTSKRKAKTSAENGKLGGRPRKKKD